MTVKNLIELIQSSAPELGETLCLIEINKAQKEFVNATGILRDEETFDFDAFSDGSITLTGTPTEILKVELVSLTRSFKVPFERDGQTITFDTALLNLGTFTALNIAYRKDAGTIDALTDELEIPEQFQEAIAWRVLWKAGLRGSKERIIFYKSEWKEAVRDAKIYANVQSGSRTINFEQYGF